MDADERQPRLSLCKSSSEQRSSDFIGAGACPPPVLPFAAIGDDFEDETELSTGKSSEGSVVSFKLHPMFTPPFRSPKKRTKEQNPTSCAANIMAQKVMYLDYEGIDQKISFPSLDDDDETLTLSSPSLPFLPRAISHRV